MICLNRRADLEKSLKSYSRSCILSESGCGLHARSLRTALSMCRRRVSYTHVVVKTSHSVPFPCRINILF